MAVQIDANEGQINFHNEEQKRSGLLSTWLKITRKFNEGQKKKEREWKYPIDLKTIVLCIWGMKSVRSESNSKLHSGSSSRNGRVQHSSLEDICVCVCMCVFFFFCHVSSFPIPRFHFVSYPSWTFIFPLWKLYWDNLPTIKFTLLKHIVQWLLIYLQSCTIATNFVTHHHSRKKPTLISSQSPFSSPPVPGDY